MKKTDKELFSQELPPLEKPGLSRIDMIGHNGNEGLHYKPTTFAIQSLFNSGWYFIGFDDEDGLRLVFKTEQDAYLDIKEIINFTEEHEDQYKVVPYNPHEDDTFARF